MMKGKVLSAIHKRKHTLLSRMQVKPPEPIESILKEIREADTKPIRWIIGRCGAWKAQRIVTR